MNTDMNVNSSDDDGSYYRHLLRRIVKKLTPVLYNMIEEFVHLSDLQVPLSY